MQQVLNQARSYSQPGLSFWKPLALFGGVMTLLVTPVAISNMVNLRGTEEIRKDGHEYIIQYDKRNDGVVLRDWDALVGDINLRLVDTNYDGVADYSDTPKGRIPVNSEQEKLFSDLTSHFYEVNPDKEALLKQKGSIH